MAEKHFTAAPDNFEGEGFTQLGLQAALDRVHALWGGKPAKADHVSPALTLGGGTTLIGTEAGLVRFWRNKDEDDRAKRAEIIDADAVDGRTRKYFAKVEIGWYTGHRDTTESVAKDTLSGDGVMGLLEQCAMFVQEKLGDVPECLYREECEKRIPSIRAQLGKARADERDGAMIVFPPANKAKAFQATWKTQSNNWYFLLVHIYLAEEDPRPNFFVKRRDFDEQLPAPQGLRDAQTSEGQSTGALPDAGSGDASA